jgi:hypothetical protein
VYKPIMFLSRLLDSLVMAIGSNTTTLMLEDVVGSMLSKEMRRKNVEGLTKDALVVRG